MFYFLIAFAATVIGALSGVGGGVIIKPILDFISDLDVGSINLLSSVTVLTMALSSIIRHAMAHTKFEKRISLLLAGGAVFGGTAGDRLLLLLIEKLREGHRIKEIQNACLLLLLLAVLVYMNRGMDRVKFQVKNTAVIIFSGFILGTVSSFLGIGGGPVNVVALILLFSMSAKEAAVNSLLLILFSQMAKLTNTAFTQGFGAYELTPLIYMIPGGIAGGIWGSKLYGRLKGSHIIRIFNGVLMFIIVVSLLNIIV